MKRGFVLPFAVLACLATSLQHLGCSPDPNGPEPDTDGDGLVDREELNVTHTSPVLPDTDGDGLSDYDEVVNLSFDPNDNPEQFNPLVADLPQLALDVVGPPVVTVQATDSDGITYTFQYSVSPSWTYGTSYSESPTYGQSNTYSFSQTNTNEQSITEPFGGSSGSSGGGDDGGGGGGGEGGAGGAGGDGGAGGSGGGAGAGGEVDAGADAAPDATSGAAPDAALDATTDATTDGASGGGGGGGGAGGAGGAGGSASSGGGGSGGGGGGTITLTSSVATTVNPSTTFSTSITYTYTAMQQNSLTLTQSQSASPSRTLTFLGGFIKLPVMLRNASDVAFRVTNLILGVTLVDAAGNQLAVDNLVPDEGLLTTFQPFSLAPYETTGPLVLSSTLLTLQQTEAVLLSRGMNIRIAAYELSDATGKPFAFDVTGVATKTALFVIDYGRPRLAEIYQVATNLDPAHPGITAGQALTDILRIPYAADPQVGLTSVRDVATSSSGSDGWTVDLRHGDGPDKTDTVYGQPGDPYDFDDIEVRAGDVVHLAFVPSNDPPRADAGPDRPPLATGAAFSGDGGLPFVMPAYDAGVPGQVPTIDGLPGGMQPFTGWPNQAPTGNALPGPLPSANGLPVSGHADGGPPAAAP